MPDYAATEVSESSAKQTYLYKIDGVNFQSCFTNAQKTITATIDGSDYDFLHPRGGISHTEFAEAGAEPERGRTLITVGIGNPIVRKHNQYPPHGNTSLVIFRQNEIDGDPYQIWSGTIVTLEIEGVEAHFQCLTDYELLKRSEGLNDTFQGLCNWFLGQHPCPVNLANWRQSVTVTAIDTENFEVTLTGTTGVANWFTAGYIEASNGDKRSVVNGELSGSDHVLTLQQNFPSTTLRVGDTVSAYPGCDRAHATGRDKFGAETGNGAGCGTNPIQTNVNPHEIGRLQ